ncbi:MAG TPA: hypothetical protein DCZ03_15135 [Gammaproteobacteria bacterium]|nr:hypothetical protein [Gammaproteobacteria bacterium]
MTNKDNMSWVDDQEAKKEEERSKEYFNVVEGKQEFILLSHCAPLAQVWVPSEKKYRVAEDGDSNVSIKGLCWVLQDGIIKSARLPYTIVKDIRSYQQNDDWEFVLPFPHTFTLTAKNAGSKEVEYSLNASPKKVEIPKEILEELATKSTPEEIVEKIKEKTNENNKPVNNPTAEEEGINPEDIPF